MSFIFTLLIVVFVPFVRAESKGFCTTDSEPLSIQLGIESSSSISAGCWSYFELNVVGNDYLQGDTTVFVDIEGTPRLLVLYTRYDALPSCKLYDSTSDAFSTKNEFLAVFQLTKIGKYYIGIYASPCDATSGSSCDQIATCNSTRNDYTQAITITASSRKSIPIWVVGVIGGAVLVVVSGVFVCMLCVIRRKRQREKLLDDEILEADVIKRLEKINMKVNSFPPGEIQVQELIGSGEFGQVYVGDWKGTKVALKKLLHFGAQNEKTLNEFFSEISVLSNLNHMHIVRLLGVYAENDGSRYIVTEFVEKGNLKDLLPQIQETIQQLDLVDMAQQLASGMEYLEQNSVLHRDLAARNILAECRDGKYVIKISDFGLSRESKDTYYVASTKKFFPVKWSAPEVLLYRKFSHKSDVWSFGVALWEIFEFGKEPYPDMSNSEVSEAVCETHYRLAQPKQCPHEIYEIMMDCWKFDPKQRPSFRVLLNRTSKLIERDINEQIQLVTAPNKPVSDFESPYAWAKWKTRNLVKYNKLKPDHAPFEMETIESKETESSSSEASGSFNETSSIASSISSSRVEESASSTL